MRSSYWRVGYTGVFDFAYWRVSGFIGFDADWKPAFFTFAAPFFRSGSFKSRFKYALKPLFESHGLEWRRPRLSALRVIAVIGLSAVPAIFAVFVGLLLYLPPFVSAFPLRQDKDGAVLAMADECRLQPAFPTQLCGCYALEMAKVISVQEVRALEKHLVLDSFLNKAKDSAKRCARPSWVKAAAVAESEVETKRKAADAITRGNAAGNAGDFDKAIASYDEAIRLDPENVIAFINRGRTYYSKLDFERAIADYSGAIRLEPKYAVAFLVKGNAYADKRDYDRAIADYSEAIQLDPNYAAAFTAGAPLMERKGDNDRAIADYNEAIRLDPKNALAFTNRGFAYSNKGDNDRAIADYNEAIRLDPKNALAFYNRGVAYQLKRDYDRAIADFNEAIRLES